MTLLLSAIAILGTISPIQAANEPLKLISVRKIWDEGKHNAFTDLIRWRGVWLCAFREGEAHVGGNGGIRVLSSTDGSQWSSSALITEPGIDLRDPKLSEAPDGRLMIVAGGSVYEGRTLLGRQPRVLFSADGKSWTAPKRVLQEGEWLWRVTWHGGKAHGISYNAAARATSEARSAAETGKVEPGPAEWKLKLLVSGDGENYELITHLDVPGHPNETTLRFLPGNEMIALTRREAGNQHGWIGRAMPPYKSWSWKEIGQRVGGPNFILGFDGSLWASSRRHLGKKTETIVAQMSAEGLFEPRLVLPSGGDTSYAGMVWHDGQIWMSYYSSHEGKSSIYLARIQIPKPG